MKKHSSNIISTEEASKLLGVSRQTLYKLRDSGEIPGKKVGGNYKFLRDGLLDYLRTHNYPNPNSSGYKEWTLKGDFATEGIKKMARRTFQELASNIEELIVR